jgi:hypothetical protein
MEETMQYEAFEDKVYAPDWRVEASNPEGDGEVYVTLFSGTDARQRAQEYAALQNERQQKAATANA